MRDKEPIARLYIVHGRVQGVGFRYFVEHYAQELGVAGYVKNRFDGTVEVYAVGKSDKITKLEKYLRAGPRFGRVDRLLENDAPVREVHGFTIKY